MTKRVKWAFIWGLFISLKLVYCTTADKGPSRDFSEHTITKPKIFHGRSKREISNTSDFGEKGGHAQDLIISLQLNGIDRILELTINHDLIGKSYFEKTQKNGSYHLYKPTAEELELCHYRGFLRHIPNSWAAVSTCSGLRGLISDGRDTYFIDKGPEDGVNYVYNGKHLRADRNLSCGFPQSHAATRLKRDTDAIRGPYNANRQSRYVELLLVVDHEEYKELGDLKTVYQHCKDIANIINALFVPLNIFIALIGVVVWTEIDEISLSTNGDTTLTNFLHYRREVLVKEHPNDNAQLLTRVQFDAGVVGKALKGPICTFEYSGGVFMDHSNVVGLVATTVAHELGHNFGMEHDNTECHCPDDRCIMAPSSSSMSPTHWSSCSLEYLALAFEHGMDYCLRNKPEKLFDSPVCGNGFVEPGEQCDCGLPHRCVNTCCNATTCMLLSNASCATGECCDFETCRPKGAGTVCRTAEHECDLPEYCTGESEYCPGDVFKIDGESCNRGKAFCYQGMCRTHSDQCQLLWGPSGNNSDVQCYEMNTKGTRHGNCGYNRLNQTYIQCYKENVYCGMVHCSHFNERLEFGMESVSILSHSFINREGNIIACRTAIVDLGLNEVDPGLTPDGAKCGEGKMCVNQKCMSVGALRKMSPYSCPGDCNGNGVCNSKGHCHCAKGFAPPFCDYPGTGGSTDSGPASDPNLGREFTIALYVIFLCVIPLLALAFIFMYYTKQNAKIWWKKSPTRLNAPWECKRPSAGTAVLLPETIVDVGIVQTSRPPGPKAALLNEPVPPRSKTLVELQSDLFGKGKGFAIRPLKKLNNYNQTQGGQETVEENVFASECASTSTRYENVDEIAVKDSSSATVKPSNRQNTWRNEEGRLKVISPPTLPNDSCYRNSNVMFFKKPKSEVIEDKKCQDAADESAIIEPNRPQISNPVLEGTTAKHLVSEGAALVPTRKAPEIPKISVSCLNESQMSVEKYDKEPPPAPVPRVDVNAERPGLLESSDDKKLLKELKESKEYPALVKLAGLLKNTSTNVNRFPSVNEKTKAKVKVGQKKIKFDREKLKSIQISNPIPQMESDGLGKESNISRAHSMREPNQIKPTIPNFGSLRIGSAKRPTSIHGPNRPTSPPPRPPPPKPLNQDYAYDDCLNLLAGKTAPLAHIDEENTPSPNNIYAVIEESPKLEAERKVHFSNENDEVSPEDKSSKCFHNTNVSSGSTESMGLLGEIVSEIQARNLESIYSSGTLKKKKIKAGDGDVKGTENSSIYNTNLSSARSDVSSSSSGNGYLNPNNINTPSTIVYEPPNESKKESKQCKDIPENRAEGTSKDGSKPCSSLLKRNSGPLGLRFTDRVDLKGKVPGEENVNATNNALAVGVNATTTGSGVKSTFTRPLLLSTPIPPKLTPQDITSSISKPEAVLEDSSKEIANVPVRKNSSNSSGNVNLKRTIKKGTSNSFNVVPDAKTATPESAGVKSTPPRKSDSSGSESEVGKAPVRPLPSLPRKPETKGSTKSGSSIVSRPLPAIPKKNSRENITRSRKPPTEKKPEVTGANVPRITSHVERLQSKFESTNCTNDLERKKSTSLSAADKPS